MNSWIYAIGNKQYTFLFKNGKIVDGSGKLFKENVLRDNFPKDGIWWHVKQNYSEVEKGDIVYVYATKGNPIFGIIGVAEVLEKRILEVSDERDEERKEICLKVHKLLDESIVISKSNCGVARKSLHRLSSECKAYITLELEKRTEI